MTLISKKIAVFSLAIGVFAFATLAVFGLGHMSGMTANENGDMAGCIFTGKTMLCKMGVIEHISLWQSIFTAMPRENLMLFALFFLLATAIFITRNILDLPRLSKNKASAQKLYLTQHPNLSLFNPLGEAFFRGILNPKIYEFAIL